MRTPIFWTPERIDELRRCYNLHMTSIEIAAHFGRSIHGVRKAAYTNKITSRERHAFIQSLRVKGRKDKAATKRRKAAAMRKRHAEPSAEAELRQGLRSPAARKKAADSRRGFAIPPELQAEYDHLRKSKRFTAAEAGQMLGLITPDKRSA